MIYCERQVKKGKKQYTQYIASANDLKWVNYRLKNKFVESEKAKDWFYGRGFTYNAIYEVH